MKQKLTKTHENPKNYLRYIILTTHRIIIKNFKNLGKKSSKSQGRKVIKDVVLISFQFIDKIELKRKRLYIYRKKGKYFHNITGIDISFTSDEYKIILEHIKEFFPYGKFYRTQELKKLGDEIDKMDTDIMVEYE